MAVANLDAFAGRRVLVTGHTGFKGAWLTCWLTRLGAAVVGVALEPPTSPSMFAAVAGRDLVEHHVLDVRDADGLAAVVAGSGAQHVFHLAAQALVGAGYDDPLCTYSTNVAGTANVLEAARTLEGLRSIVVVTSDKCYENRDLGRPFREDDPLGGDDPYSSSKAAAEIVTAAYRRSFYTAEDGPTVVTGRAGNAIGGGDWGAERLVPDLARAAGIRRPAPVRHPGSRRPWQHVLDPLHGYLQAALAPAAALAGSGHAFNFGPATAATVATVAESFTKAWGDGASYEVVSPPGGYREAHSLSLDASLAAERLGWRPALDLESAVQWTVDWYRRYYDGGAPSVMRAITTDQIDAYAERADAAD